LTLTNFNAGDPWLIAGGCQERERALELATAHTGSTLFAEEGFWGKEYRDCMVLIDIQLITLERHRSGPRPAGRDGVSRNSLRRSVACRRVDADRVGSCREPSLDWTR
jgi:hypothetical protein